MTSVSRIALAVATLLVGVLIGVLVTVRGPITVSPTLGVGEILNAFVTVVIAVALADLLTRRATDRRVEKDLLLQDCADVRAAVLAVRDMANRSHRGKTSFDERNHVLALLGDASESLSDLRNNLGYCFTMRDIDVDSLQESLLKYKVALTGGIFPREALDDATYLMSERRYKEFKLALAKLRFELNRR